MYTFTLNGYEVTFTYLPPSCQALGALGVGNLAASTSLRRNEQLPDHPNPITQTNYKYQFVINSWKPDSERALQMPSSSGAGGLETAGYSLQGGAVGGGCSGLG